jgi:hypothetical protein
LIVPIQLVRTDALIDECERHLDQTGSLGTPVESYLTQHALVILCAEVQTEIYRIIETRAAKSADIALQQFTIAASKRVLRSVKTSEIAGLMGYFGSEIKDRFAAALNERDVTVYNNAVQNRHDVAHKTGVQVTLAEVKAAAAAAARILESVDTELN